MKAARNMYIVGEVRRGTIVLLAVAVVIAGLVAYALLRGTWITVAPQEGRYSLRLSWGRLAYASGLVAAVTGGRRGGEVRVSIQEGSGTTDKCIRVERGLPPLYCVRSEGGEITVYVDSAVWGRVGADKAELGINLLLGEMLYNTIGGGEERYWSLYNRLEPLMWRVEAR